MNIIHRFFLQRQCLGNWICFRHQIKRRDEMFSLISATQNDLLNTGPRLGVQRIKNVFSASPFFPGDENRHIPKYCV